MSDGLNCVLLPYRNGGDSLARGLDALLRNLPGNTTVLLVDDGSSETDKRIEKYVAEGRVVRLRHPSSRGPAAARNTGMDWCRSRAVETAVLLDSDCIPEADFVQTHIRLHGEHPDAVCIGGSIRGTGKSFWARLDGLASWFTSVPGARMRKVGGLYHIPTTNMSLKLKRLPTQCNQFNERLRTGEDVDFVRRLRAADCLVLFSPVPTVSHQDRERFGDMLRHQYRWALHTYAMRSGGSGNLGKRILLSLIMIPLIPVYAIAGSLINVLPWLTVSPLKVLWWPPLLILYAIKAIGVIDGILCPSKALYGPA